MCSDKRVRLTQMAFGLALLLCSCGSSTSVADRSTDAWTELDAHADALFEALEQVAADRQLPIARRDAVSHRLTTDWIEEDSSTRRRYFLSVFVHPAGLVVRAHIVRQELRSEAEGTAVWRELPSTEAVAAEEMSIVEEAHRIWSEDDP